MREHAPALSLIVIVAGGVFCNALDGAFVWDDEYIILDNARIRDLRGSLASFGPGYWRSLRRSGDRMWGRDYRPVAEVSFAVDYALWGLRRAGYHAHSILLHVACSVLVYFLGLRVFRDRRGAAFCALLFAAHPIHVEAVVWAKARSSLQALLLALTSMLLYLQYVERPSRARCALALYVASLLAFALALESKLSGMVTPALLVLYLWCFRPQRPLGSVVLSLLPFAGTAAVFLAVRAAVQALPPGGVAGGSYHALPTVISILGAYLRLLVAPLGLCLEHDVNPTSSFLEPNVLRAVPWVVALIATTIIAVRRAGVWPFAVAWLLVGLVPPSSLTTSGRLVAETRAYAPSVGFCMLAAALLWTVPTLAWLRSAPQLGRTVSVALCATVVVMYAGLTLDRNADWSSRERIFSDTLAKNPRSYKAHDDLAAIYILRGDAEAAIPHLREAVALRPTDPEMLNNLAVACRKTARYEEAIATYKRLLQLKPRDVGAHVDLARAYAQSGDEAKAIEQFETALEIDPENIDAHYDLAAIDMQMGRPEDAIAQLERALQIDPENAQVYHALGVAHYAVGEYALAAQAYLRCVRLEPSSDETWFAMAEAYEKLDDTAQAIWAYRQCVELQGAMAEEARGRLDELSRAAETQRENSSR